MHQVMLAGGRRVVAAGETETRFVLDQLSGFLVSVGTVCFDHCPELLQILARPLRVLKHRLIVPSSRLWYHKLKMKYRKFHRRSGSRVILVAALAEPVARVV